MSSPRQGRSKPDPERMPSHARFVARPCRGDDILDVLRTLMGHPARRLRNLILDFGSACAPVEVWLAEPPQPGPARPRFCIDPGSG
jgi:hypothetical protein